MLGCVISAKQPTLINIGRSNIVSEADLLTAIDSGWISAAVLDVFDEEPLPGRGYQLHQNFISIT